MISSPANASGRLLAANVRPEHQSMHSLGRLARYEEYRAFYLGDQWMGGACAGREAGHEGEALG